MTVYIILSNIFGKIMDIMNEVGWLLLLLLDTVGIEKDGFMDSNSQLKHAA